MIAPEIGQVWDAGWSPDMEWQITDIDDSGVVWCIGLRNGEPTTSYLRWPKDRWRALVEKENLTLVGEHEGEAA
jgi:hypothetical protein